MAKTILIAEDDRDLQDLYRMLLESRYRIVQAADGVEALERFRECDPDLTLMDVRMPRMGGDVAIRRILELRPDARVLAVTAFRHSEQELGVPVLRKGFDTQELLEAIESVLSLPVPESRSGECGR